MSCCEYSVNIMLRMHPGMELQNVTLKVMDDVEMRELAATTDMGRLSKGEMHITDDAQTLSLVIHGLKFCPFCGKKKETLSLADLQESAR